MDLTATAASTPQMLDRVTAAALSVSRAGGDTMFADLARDLAQLLGVDAVVIGVRPENDNTPCLPVRGRIRALSAWLDGHALPEFEYDVEFTPCRFLSGHEARFVASGAHSEFAPETDMAQLGFDGYAARSLLDDAQRQIGLVAVLHRRPLSDRALTEALLHIFASRVAAEVQRLRAQSALAVSQRDYRAVFEAAEDAIFVHDYDTGAVLDANPKACALYGWSLDELRRLPPGAMHAGTPPYTPAHASYWFAKAKQGENPRFEWRSRRKDGSLQWDEVSLKSTEIGGKSCVIAVMREISARKFAEEALRASEAQYRAIFEASVDGLIVKDADHRIVDANDAFAAMHGYRREEMRGRSIADFIPPELRARCEVLLPGIIDGRPCHIEAQSMRRDGHRFDVEIHGVPMHYHGQPHALVIMRDISDAKRAEQALRASEEQYRAIFNASADALLLRDAAFRVVDANETWERLTGYRRADVLGADAMVSAPAQTAERLRALHDRALAGEHGVEETRIQRRDGVQRDVELRAVPVRYSDKPHVLWMERDITERKLAETERARLEAQLRQAQKMEAIGQLTGGIAHDFNNLLTSVVGYVALAAERDSARSDLKLAYYLDQAKQSCSRARDLIQQMLTFSRGQRGERHRIALGTLVREGAKMVRPMLPASLVLTVETSAQTIVEADPVQIDQILMNLCINARDATGGSGEIRVSVRERNEGDTLCASCRQAVVGRFAELSVADDGSGISPHALERIFDPFFSTKEVGKGSGMGLAVVHGVVHEHGGHVCVENLPGRGCVFRVLIPIVDGTVSAADETSGLRNTLPRRPLVGRVLLVDDEHAVLAFMRELLETWGLDVRACAAPAEALQVLGHDTQISLVITDQTMPGMTGLALAGEIAARHPHIPVVLYTGYSEGLPPGGVEAAGIRALVRKPIEPVELRSAIAPLLAAFEDDARSSA